MSIIYYVAATADNTTQCSSGQFYCSSQFTFPQCISNSWVCDGDSDCSNGADEATCGTYYNSILFATHIKLYLVCKSYNIIALYDDH